MVFSSPGLPLTECLMATMSMILALVPTLISWVVTLSGSSITITGLPVDWRTQDTRPGWPGTSPHPHNTLGLEFLLALPLLRS